MSRQSISKPYNMTEELRDCLDILAAQSLSSRWGLAALAIDELAEKVPIYFCDISERPVGAVVSLTHEAVSIVKGRAKREHCSSSLVIYSCLKAVVLEKIKIWGCETPQEFLVLMQSPNPLELLATKLFQETQRQGRIQPNKNEKSLPTVFPIAS